MKLGIHAVFRLSADFTNHVSVRNRVAVISSGRPGMQNPLDKSFVRQGFQRPVNRCARNVRIALSHFKKNRVYGRVRFVLHESLINLLSLNGNRQPARFTQFFKIRKHGVIKSYKTRFNEEDDSLAENLKRL